MSTARKGLTSDLVLDAIIRVRRDTGACSYRSLAIELGVTIGTARYWVVRLTDEGLVVAGPAAGSIRPA